MCKAQAPRDLGEPTPHPHSSRPTSHSFVLFFAVAPVFLTHLPFPTPGTFSLFKSDSRSSETKELGWEESSGFVCPSSPASQAHVPLCVCVHVCACARMHGCVCVCLCTSTCVRTVQSICVWPVCVRVLTCTDVFMRVHVCT